MGDPVTLVSENNTFALAGVAPGAWLLNYRVFYLSATAETYASDAQILKAFEDAAEEGATIISNSWGRDSFYNKNGLIDQTIVCPFLHTHTYFISCQTHAHTRVHTQNTMEKCGYLFLFAAGNAGPSLMTTDRSNYAMRVAAVTSHSYLTDNILTVEPDGTYPILCLLTHSFGHPSQAREIADTVALTHVHS